MQSPQPGLVEGKKERQLRVDHPCVQAAEAALSRSGYQSLSSVRCQLDGENIVLSGVCPSYYVKQIAQELVRGVIEGKGVQNDIEVWGRPQAAADQMADYA